MADLALDYGPADTGVPTAVPMQDEAMKEDVPHSEPGSRFYALPTDQAVEAGAQRGPEPLSGAESNLDDAALVGVEPPTETPDPPAVEGGSDILLDTLLIEGLPITQLSTSRLFAYITHFGAQPLGLEWIDDQRCKVVFADERSARLGLEYLVPPSNADEMQSTEIDNAPLPNMDTLLEYDPDSWHSEYITSLVTPRKAHRIPAKLYNHIERQAALVEMEQRKRTQEAVSCLPDDVPEIYREMEEADCKAGETREVRDLNKLRSSLWLRHAVSGVDRKEARASTRSQWYKRHGHEAGREIVPKLLQVGEVKESIELFPDWKPSKASQQSRDDRKSRMQQLDSELEGYLASRNADADAEPERRPGEMMADVIDDSTRREGDLMDRFTSSRRSGRGHRHDRTVEADIDRWTHDAYESLDHDRSDHRRASRRARPTRNNLASMDDELEQLGRSRRDQHQRELSPSRRPSHSRYDTDQSAGRVKVKGRGRMKAPGFDDRWNSSQDTSRSGSNLLDRIGHAAKGPLADRFA